LERIIRNPEALAAELEGRITPQDRAEWIRGSIQDWVLEAHRLAQRVAYEDLGNADPAPITPAYERLADPVIETQLVKAGVRLAYLLDSDLAFDAAEQESAAGAHVGPARRQPGGTGLGEYETRRLPLPRHTKGGYITQKHAQEKGYHPAAGRPCM
jgi:hypothetical protein